MSTTSIRQRNVSTASPAKRAVRRGAKINWTVLLVGFGLLICIVLAFAVLASSALVRASVLESFS